MGFPEDQVGGTRGEGTEEGRGFSCAVHALLGLGGRVGGVWALSPNACLIVVDDDGRWRMARGFLSLWAGFVLFGFV